MCLTVYLKCYFVAIVLVELVFLIVFEVDPLRSHCLLFGRLTPIRWYVPECMWTRIGRFIFLISTRTTLGRPTTLKRSVTTSGSVPLRNETQLLEETLLSVFSVEGYDCQINQCD